MLAVFCLETNFFRSNFFLHNHQQQQKQCRNAIFDSKYAMYLFRPSVKDRYTYFFVSFSWKCLASWSIICLNSDKKRVISTASQRIWYGRCTAHGEISNRKWKPSVILNRCICIFVTFTWLQIFFSPQECDRSDYRIFSDIIHYLRLWPWIFPVRFFQHNSMGSHPLV